MPKKKEEINLEESIKTKVEEPKKKTTRAKKTVTKNENKDVKTEQKAKSSTSRKSKKEVDEVKKEIKTKGVTEKKASKTTSKKSVANKKETEASKVKKEATKAKKADVEKVVAKKEKSASKTENKTSTPKKTAKSSTAKKETSTKKKTSAKKKNDNSTLENIESSKENKSSKTTKKSSKNSVEDKKIKVASPSKEKSKDEKEEKVKEETIIEKIKNFIAKIVAMQEEAKNEVVDKKEKAKRTKKSKTAKTAEKTIENPPYLTEYYDLPYRYNETVVKILAQTPKRLFVYWDVSDADKIRYKNAFGEDFFEKTYPVLLVRNEDKNYVTEIVVNDFANSWYVNINDPKTKYTIQLGRKFKEIPKIVDIAKMQEEKIILHTDYLPIAESNKLEVPNDKVLFASIPRVIKFRNVKTYEEKEKTISNLKTQYGKIYDIKEFYQEMYKEEFIDERLEINNPTSGGFSSSSFK